MSSSDSHPERINSKPGEIAGLVGRSSAELPRYDFRDMPRLAADSEAFAAMQQRLAGLISGRIGPLLGGPVESRFAFCEMLRYDEFIYSLPAVSCLSTFRIDPPNAQCCMNLGLALAHRMINRLLAGGDNAFDAVPPDRALTRIEQTMILPIIEAISSSLAEAYGPAGQIAVREESLESSPSEVRIMPGDEMITAVRIDLGFNAAHGRLSLALPAPVTQMLCDPAATPPPPMTRQQREAQKQDMAGNLLAASVELRAVLSQTRLRLDEVLSLQEGDVIMTNRAASAGMEARLEIQGRERFSAEPGRLCRSAAIAITGPRAASQPTDGRSDQ